MAKRKRTARTVLPRGKWISGMIRVTKGGKIEAKIPRKAVRNPDRRTLLMRLVNAEEVLQSERSGREYNKAEKDRDKLMGQLAPLTNAEISFVRREVDEYMEGLHY